MDKRIEEERQRLIEVLDILPAYLILLTPDYQVAFSNRFFSERFGESHGRRCYDYLFGRGEPCEVCETYKVFKTGAPLQWEWTGPDNRNYHIYDYPFRDVDGSTFIMEVGIDITEQKKAQDMLESRVAERTAELAQSNRALQAYAEELKRSNQALEDFASIASHDLQEPLRKVRAFGDLLLLKYAQGLGEDGQNYLRRMEQAANRMQGMIDSLLTYARITTKGQSFVEVDLKKVVEEVLADLEVRIAETGGAVKIGDLPVLRADPLQMRQLFQNLIGNALKYHREDAPPLVKVDSQPQSDHLVEITVEDNGAGFEMQYAEKVFEPFVRIEGRASKTEGNGMGLTICRKIVERHGATISVSSVPGQGSTFTIRFPG